MEERSKRGGAFHQPRPDLDESVLLTFVSTFRTDIMNVHAYETISCSQAVSGEGLAANFNMLQKLLELSPQAELPARKTKTSIEKVLAQSPGLNGTVCNNNVYAGLRLERLVVMLYHLRRLQRDPQAMMACSNKTSGSSMMKVKELLGMMTDAPAGAAESQDQVSVPGTECYPTDCEAYPAALTAKAAKTKCLKRSVTLDDDGFPKLLTAKHARASSPAKSPIKEAGLWEQMHPAPQVPQAKSKAKATAKAKAQPQPEEQASPKSPAPLAKAKAKGKAKAQAEAEVQEASDPTHSSLQTKDWTVMYYKANNTMGIRRKFAAKNQIFSFGSKSTMTKHELEKVGKLCVIKMLEGKSEEDVAVWAKSVVAAMSVAKP